MTYTAEIDIMPHKELLDPQGKAVKHGLHNLSFAGVQDVRVGKHISLRLEAASQQEAEKMAEEACKKLLANPIMEAYRFTVSRD